MGCKSPGADAVVPKYGLAFSIAWFSVALYYKAGKENRDLRVLWLSQGERGRSCGGLVTQVWFKWGCDELTMLREQMETDWVIKAWKPVMR